MTAERRRQIYEERKAQHLCTTCGAQDAHTLAGKTLCKKCQDYGVRKATIRQRARRAAGLCGRCGKSDARTKAGLCYCTECAKAQKERYRKSRNRKAGVEA